MDYTICVVLNFCSTLTQIRLSYSKHGCLSVFHLAIRIVLMITLCQYPHNTSNPLQNTKQYMFCDGLQNMCCLQLLLKINTNAVIYCKIVFGCILWIRIMLMTTFSLYQHKYSIEMHCKTVRHTYFALDYSICVVFSFFLTSTRMR